MGKSALRTWFDFVCGIPKKTSADDVREPQEERLKLLDETPFWKCFLDINAVIAMCIMCFMLGYFA